ncbi:MAG: hypothetical protein M4D80_03100 [Myxococcota bacterium]|nr:hypothetical protein [Myxococcota bacterium]
MRALAVLLLYVGVARADGVGAGAAVGAGGQGSGTYSAIELGLDAQWRGARLGLGGRGVWINGEWRERDWQTASDAVRAVRLLEVRADWFALAGGRLAPAQLAHVADGHRAALDDRPRTGARVAANGEHAVFGAEIDDVLDPSLVGAALAWDVTPAARVHAATAIDPIAEVSAVEFALGRAWRGEHALAEVGGGFVGEPGRGGHALAFADFAIERGAVRWIASAEGRAGNGSVGGAFGPLHRLERAMYEDASGVGGAISLGAIAERFGWVRASVRARPAMGPIASAAIGAPMSKWLQAGAWFAATRRHVAGAGEVRVAWARHYSTVIEVARMYDADAMLPTPAWSVTAWFGITAN